jgi:hypothetical protein
LRGAGLARAVARIGLRNLAYNLDRYGTLAFGVGVRGRCVQMRKMHLPDASRHRRPDRRMIDACARRLTPPAGMAAWLKAV